MAAVTPRNTSSRIDKWNQTFPENLEDKTESKDFVYRLLLCTSAMILEKRRFLPEDCFTRREIEKLQIPMYNLKNENGKRLKTKVEGLKAAIENAYLNEFAIVFYRKPDEEDVIEVYSFKFFYSDENVKMSIDSGIGSQELRKHLLEFEFEGLDMVRNKFVSLMRILHRYLTKCLEDLPENADASFRVSFTENTPEEFIPTGFVASDKFYQIDCAKELDEIGVIGGGHHRYQIIGTSLLKKANLPDFNRTIASVDESFIANRKSQTQQSGGKMKSAKRIQNVRRFGTSVSFDHFAKQ